MASETAIEIIDKQDWMEPLANTIQAAIDGAFKSGGEAGQKVANFLHGTWLGHPLHSVLTDVPIGSWTAALVLDAMDEISGREEFGRGADAAVAVGIAGAVGSAVTGLTDWHKIDGQARRIGLTHGLMNATALACYTTSLVLRRRNARQAGRGFSLLGFAISSAAAYLGGHLVYSKQIGVDHTADQKMPDKFIAVLAESELAENTPLRVKAEGTPVLLVRQGGNIYAVAETCSHLGGPLSQGKLEGETVICPWHGSRFALSDGAVVDGPSTHPQPCFETRVRDGQIEVRAR